MTSSRRHRSTLLASADPCSLSPADQLAAAAATLRAGYEALRADSAAMNPPRHQVTWFPADALDGATITGPDDGWLPHSLTTPQAAWISGMHPDLAGPLAGMLEASAKRAAQFRDPRHQEIAAGPHAVLAAWVILRHRAPEAGR